MNNRVWSGLFSLNEEKQLNKTRLRSFTLDIKVDEMALVQTEVNTDVPHVLRRPVDLEYLWMCVTCGYLNCFFLQCFLLNIYSLGVFSF